MPKYRSGKGSGGGGGGDDGAPHRKSRGDKHKRKHRHHGEGKKKSHGSGGGQRAEEPEDDTAPAPTFDALNLKPALLRGIYAFGFERPSAIQQRAIRPIVRGRDVIAQSQSGTVSFLTCMREYVLKECVLNVLVFSHLLPFFSSKPFTTQHQTGQDGGLFHFGPSDAG